MVETFHTYSKADRDKVLMLVAYLESRGGPSGRTRASPLGSYRGEIMMLLGACRAVATRWKRIPSGRPTGASRWKKTRWSTWNTRSSSRCRSSSRVSNRKGKVMKQNNAATAGPIKIPDRDHPITIERNPNRVLVSIGVGASGGISL
jgi:phage tail tape-measure protein